MHDDLFDFFYDALPGYEKVGLRRTLLGCWGSFQDPDHCNFAYKDMENWGRKMFVTPGVVVDGKLVTTSLVDINLGIRILLGSSYYDDWTDQEMFVTQRPAGQPGRPPAPLEPAHQPQAAEARPRRQVQLGHVAALVRRQGPPGPRHRRRPARPALVDRAGRAGRHRLRQGHRHQRADQPAQDRAQGPGDASSGRSRSGATPSSATAPAPTSRPTRRPARCTSARRRWRRSGPAGPRPGSRSRCRTRPSAAASPRPCAACSRTTWSSGTARSPTTTRTRRRRGTPTRATSTARPGPYEDAVQDQPLFEENGRGQLQGHRHHADRPQLRPVPAVRRPHVPRGRARR